MEASFPPNVARMFTHQSHMFKEQYSLSLLGKKNQVSQFVFEETACL